jgi:hypothetical protein
MRQANPYRPGSDRAPGVLAGRGEVLGAAAEAIDGAALGGRTPVPLVLVGDRGVGKSVVLAEIATMAADRYGWLTVPVAARPDETFLAEVVGRLGEVQRVLEEAAPGPPSELEALAARLGVVGDGENSHGEPRPAGPGPAGPTLDRALTGACNAAVGRTSGVVLAVDDLHLARDHELGDLVAALDRHAADGWPLVVVVAGRPAVQDRRRSVAYLERGEWLEVGLLAHDDAVIALRGPAASAGRPLAADGAALLAEASGGHPHAVQVLGHHAWCGSDGAPVITVDHARVAIATARAELASWIIGR